MSRASVVGTDVDTIVNDEFGDVSIIQALHSIAWQLLGEQQRAATNAFGKSNVQVTVFEEHIIRSNDIIKIKCHVCGNSTFAADNVARYLKIKPSVYLARESTT